ncbi:DUF6876 family protein [Chitinophaga varians]|uniref:DUF6876 family protein n=1 Tax=Chitinophaga varians TaxID=2202339 RepID=UPI00165FADB5|nr:DUF6876 family protein [Chitinophaga varians]MBC9915039.1 hypothetical protein [Chitinophaga varians]
MEQKRITANTDAVNRLMGFTGTRNWYQHGFAGKLLMDGLRELRDVFSYYWLIDDILLLTIALSEPFQV